MNSEKAYLYAELEIKWTKRFSWFLSRTLMVCGLFSIVFYFLSPNLANRIIDGLLGAVAFFLILNTLLLFREKKLKRFLSNP